MPQESATPQEPEFTGRYFARILRCCCNNSSLHTESAQHLLFHILQSERLLVVWLHVDTPHVRYALNFQDCGLLSLETIHAGMVRIKCVGVLALFLRGHGLILRILVSKLGSFFGGRGGPIVRIIWYIGVYIEDPPLGKTTTYGCVGYCPHSVTVGY